LSYPRSAIALLVTLSVGIGSSTFACSNSGTIVALSIPIQPPTDGGPSDAGEAVLLGLTVTATRDAAPAIALVPPFSPSVFDYYVRCASGPNALTISMSAGVGAESALAKPIASPAQAEQSVDLEVDEGQAIVAVATRGPATTEYWIRCLPHDFPTMEMQKHPSAGVAQPGYYLLGNSESASGAGGYAMVLDSNGVPVWYLRQTAGFGVVNVDNIFEGAISFLPYRSQPIEYEIHHLSSLTTTFARPKSTALDEHELLALPNGHLLAISNAVQGGVDLGGLRLEHEGKVDVFGADSYILECNLVEFDSDNRVVWSWVGTDHLDPQRETRVPAVWANKAPDGSPVADPFHCNSIDVDRGSGNLLVSARDLDAVFYIERSSGKILWKMGGTSYSKDSPIHVSVDDPFYRQHDARFQTWAANEQGWAGQVSMFDDQSEEPSPARAAVFDLVVPSSAGSAAASTATLAWQYKGAANAASKGSFRITADGSRVICWGTSSGNPAFSEVDVDDNDLMDFYFTDDNSSYRTIKVPLTAFDLALLRSTAGRP
jgi:hypothetical protein